MADNSVPDQKQCRICREVKDRTAFRVSETGFLCQPCKRCRVEQENESRRLRFQSRPKICGCCRAVKPRSEFHYEPYTTPAGRETSRCTGTCAQCVLAGAEFVQRDDVKRQCKRCGEVKPINQFSSARKATWRHANPEVCLARSRAASKRRTPEQKLKALLKQEYGLTLEAYQAMIEAQHGCCAICLKPPVPQKRKAGFNVDHCHVTGKIRGLLCHQCNVSLGLLKEDPVRVRSLLEYLIKHLE